MNNRILLLLINILTPFKEFELNALRKTGVVNLLVARLFTLIGVLIIVYILSALFFVFGGILVNSFIQQNETIYPSGDYLWAVPSLFAFPIILRIFTCFNDRTYSLIERCIEVLETFLYTFRLSQVHIAFEIFSFLMFGTFYSIILMLSMFNILDVNVLNSILENKSSALVLFTISITVYLTVRILILEEKNDIQKFIKLKRTFLLWSISALLTFSFVVNDLYNIKFQNFFSADFPFACVTLLLAIEKAVESYKKLRNHLKKLIEEGTINIHV
jgi:hypothetical protein